VRSYRSWRTDRGKVCHNGQAAAASAIEIELGEVVIREWRLLNSRNRQASSKCRFTGRKEAGAWHEPRLLIQQTNHFALRRLPALSEVPNTNAFCRTAPSERRSLRAIFLAGISRANDLSSRTSLFVHSRRVIFFRAAMANLPSVDYNERK
jgi:hypothetical protein